jgi:hypothetical protein
MFPERSRTVADRLTDPTGKSTVGTQLALVGKIEHDTGMGAPASSIRRLDESGPEAVSANETRSRGLRPTTVAPGAGDVKTIVGGVVSTPAVSVMVTSAADRLPTLSATLATNRTVPLGRSACGMQSDPAPLELQLVGSGLPLDVRTSVEASTPERKSVHERRIRGRASETVADPAGETNDIAGPLPSTRIGMNPLPRLPARSRMEAPIPEADSGKSDENEHKVEDAGDGQFASFELEYA